MSEDLKLVGGTEVEMPDKAEPRKCCGVCDHYVGNAKSLNADGLCRGGVPQVIVTEYVTRQKVDGSVVIVANQFNSFHPVVKFGNYCGLFTPKNIDSIAGFAAITPPEDAKPLN